MYNKEVTVHKYKRIHIIGSVASGKTTLAKRLSSTWNILIMNWTTLCGSDIIQATGEEQKRKGKNT
ncbi:hypothetical protein SAMN04487936_101463 [Halobacillus dabanensis]|uniref:AAA domain-containing protein n=1 Tax=Halobacillus dabanensis TaxID=240302 RepID=A0A1I3PWK0_HALDA|nr:hypothetical protein SAMN04487936_101463 [Halobacillus dabanensis]